MYSPHHLSAFGYGLLGVGPHEVEVLVARGIVN